MSNASTHTSAMRNDNYDSTTSYTTTDTAPCWCLCFQGYQQLLDAWSTQGCGGI